jgi:DNA-binding CsgD family transcriptional regulator
MRVIENMTDSTLTTPEADGGLHPDGVGSSSSRPETQRSPIENSWGAADLEAADLRAVLDYTEQIAALTDTNGVHQMLAGLAALVRADAATLARIDLRSGHEVAVIWPESRVVPDVLARYAAVSATHPVRAFLAQQARIEAHRWAPIRISDVISLPRWRSSALYSASHTGIDDQMCGLIGVRGSAIQVLELSRYQGLFTDRQAALLGAGRAHVTAAVRRVGKQTRRILQLAPHLQWVTGPVAIPESGHFRPLSAGGPTGMNDSADFDGNANPSTRGLRGGPVRHGVDRVPLATARQRQILLLVAQGLTDAQIGRRLGLSSATVSKHLTRAYKRLGVPNRAAAVRLLGAA